VTAGPAHPLCIAFKGSPATRVDSSICPPFTPVKEPSDGQRSWNTVMDKEKRTGTQVSVSGSQSCPKTLALTALTAKGMHTFGLLGTRER